MGFTKNKRAEDPATQLSNSFDRLSVKSPNSSQGRRTQSSGSLDQLSLARSKRTQDVKMLPCQICDRMSVVLGVPPLWEDRSYLSYAEKEDIFHGRGCSYSHRARSDTLCSFCTHLRLGHLFECPQYFEEIIIWVPPEISLELGCAFCRYRSSFQNLKAYEDSFDDPRWLHHPKPNASSNDFIRLTRKPNEMRNGTADLGTIDFILDGKPQTTVSTRDVDISTKFVPRKAQDWTSIKLKIAQCHYTHGPCKEKSCESTYKDFRVIDIDTMQLVVADSSCHFAALSYVWGNVKDSKKLKASMSNISLLMKPGALVPDELPKTISDAIQVCKELEIRYLWVDRLCIIQDSQEDMDSQIHAMGSVFGSAHIVLVALVDNMDSGIPGISSTRKPRSLDVDGLTIAKTMWTTPWHLAFEKLSSIWQSRAWTYQEAALARRILYLGNGPAFLRCRVYASQDFVSLELFPKMYDFVQPQLSEHEALQEWFFHLTRYTKRKLSVPTDIYNAFIGISNCFYGPNSLHYGHPKNDFENSLAFAATKRTPSRLRLFPQGLPKNLQLPSWSWASTDGVVFSVPLNNNCRPLITWAANNDKDVERFECIANRRSRRISALEHAWTKGVINYDSLSGAIQRCDLARELERPEIIWDKILELLCVKEPERVSRNLSKELFDDIPLKENKSYFLKPGTLLGRGQIAFLRPSRSRRALLNLRDCELLLKSHDDLTIGYLNGGTPFFDSDLLPRLQYEAPIELVAILADQEVRELSFHLRFQMFGDQTFQQKEKLEQIWSDRSLDLTFCDRKQEPLPVVPIVHVMAIGWRGPIAIKIGIGWVLLTAWLKAKREIKTILLQ
ncbi:heterokaryon incompatibility protein-domain-containing protein [Phyllosticta capitalensis]